MRKQLSAHSSLAELTTRCVESPACETLRTLREELDRDPSLPGVIVRSEDGCASLISREHLFRRLSLPFSRELVLDRPIAFFLDKFAQSSLTKSGGGGTELGLAIGRQIVAAHGDRIWAENCAEGGAVFYCELSAHVPDCVSDDSEA